MAADRRTALDKHLGLSEEDSRFLLGGKLENLPSTITVSNTEELATGIGVSLGLDLRPRLTTSAQSAE